MPPMGYDIGTIGATATTTSALIASLLTTTAANKPSASITSVWANIGGNAMTTSGSGYVAGSTWQTVGVQTTPGIAAKKNFLNPTASTGVISLLASGSIGTGTQTQRITVGFNQNGGTGFWMATSPDMAWTLPQGGTVSGYGDFLSRTAIASMLINYMVEFYES